MIKKKGVLSMKSYPYIESKRMYAAVMRVEAAIKENGEEAYDEAVKFYAAQYEVNIEELEKELEKRRLVDKENTPTFKMQQFLIRRSVSSNINPEWKSVEEMVVKGRTKETVQARYKEIDEKEAAEKSTDTIIYTYKTEVIPV